MKKLLLTILLFSLTGCGNQINLGAKKVKLKAEKNKILHNQEIEVCEKWKENLVDNGTSTEQLNIDCQKTSKVIKYKYISDVTVPPKTKEYKGQTLQEDMSRRSDKVHIYKIPSETLGANATTTVINKVGNRYIGEFYSASSQSYIDGVWYTVHTATATPEVYEDETATTTVERIKGWFGYTATAACGDSGGSCFSTTKDSDIKSTNADWDTAHDGDGTIAVSTSANGYGQVINAFAVKRAIFNFPTAAIGAGNTVTAVDFHFDTVAVYNINSSYENFTSFDGSFPVAATKAEYLNFGSTKYAVDRDISTITANVPTSMAFIQAGLDAINVTGDTNIGGRVGKDLDDSEPTGSNGLRFKFFDDPTPGERPFLEITFEESGVLLQLLSLLI